MHEISIAQSLLATVEQEISEYEPVRVERIKLRIGKLTHIVPDILRSTFKMCTQGTMAEGAMLDIEEVPFQIRCHACQQNFIPSEPLLSCPVCGGIEVSIISGRELQIESIEIEDGT